MADPGGDHRLAHLLAFCLGAQCGDPLQAEVPLFIFPGDPLLSAIWSCTLQLFTDADSGPTIGLRGAINQAELMAHLAAAGAVLKAGSVGFALRELDQAYALVVDSTEDYEGFQASEDEILFAVVRRTSGLTDGQLHDREILSVLREKAAQLSNYRDRDPLTFNPALRDQLARFSWMLTAPPTGLTEALLSLNAKAEKWDRVFQLAETLRPEERFIYTAPALRAKGLTDAALVVYDDAIREAARTNHPGRHVARYAKARLLVDIGDLRGAQRELARLYADDPTFEDSAGLVDLVKIDSGQRGRQPISEEVRHAVWRRDEGRCVQCGSRESLEFDHVIPVSKGGANTERNLQLLCEMCNRQKGARI
ncbi:MAG: HNH endonuclease [Solirubrobacteraceae bacterium]